MIFEWETDEERVSRFMKIAPVKKMEWLRKMQEFTLKTSSRRLLAIRWQLRRKRSLGGTFSI